MSVHLPGPDAAREDIARLIAGLARLPSEEFRTTLTAQVQELFAVHGRQWALEAGAVTKRGHSRRSERSSRR